MKKILLGITLSVGLSGYAMANLHDKVNDRLYNDSTITDYYHAYKEITVDCIGVKTSFTLWGHASACSTNQENGEIRLHIIGRITCKAESINDFNDSLESLILFL